ncbi:high mobility group box [Lophium mytilinum]|uniref:High mobility group box n=1 Tax=Lophium mytilinum TaxID=390894 RepID=A0A6A6QI10_9PEZI|nr:high mobility group box [Lophium mytilinum]
MPIARPQSAYSLFVKNNKEEVKNEHPNATSGDIAKALTAKWKALENVEKEPYIRGAAEDKARYEDERASQGGDESEED